MDHVQSTMLDATCILRLSIYGPCPQEGSKRIRKGDIYGRIEHQADRDKYYGSTVASHQFLNTAFDHKADKASEFNATDQY